MSRPTNEQQRRHNISRAVSKMRPEILQKLEVAFSIDCNIVEACLYAGISQRTYYYWMERNPDLLQRFESLRNRPMLKARQTIMDSLGDPKYASQYAAAKRPDEYSPKNKVELSGRVQQDSRAELTPEVAAVIQEMNLKLREAIAAPHKGPKI